MFKRIFLIGALGISLMAFSVTAVGAWSFVSGGTYWCHYKIWYDIRGGQKPGTLTTFLASGIQVLDACLVCKNPGSKRLDVRIGKGGITLVIYSTDRSFQFDDRGKIYAEQTVHADVDFIYNDPLHPCYQDLECSQAAFEDLWHVSVDDCRNKGWLPFQYLMKSFYLTGRMLTDCEWKCLDQQQPPPEEECLQPFAYPCYDKNDEPCFCNEDDWSDRECKCYDENGNVITDPVNFCNCEVADDITLWCATDEECRSWADDGQVTYHCVEVGAPIAFDDHYSIRRNKTLTVSAPGVLANDMDLELDPLTVAKVNGSDANVGFPVNTKENMTVTLNADGSFTYEPDPGWTGVDSFTYEATDGTLNGNEATVTITVK